MDTTPYQGAAAPVSFHRAIAERLDRWPLSREIWRSILRQLLRVCRGPRRRRIGCRGFVGAETCGQAIEQVAELQESGACDE